MRNFLLEHSRVIVQDDSGIPLRAFPKGWDVQCYGRYVPHNETFAKYHQPDLAAVYQRQPAVDLSVSPSAIIGKKKTASSCSPRPGGPAPPAADELPR